MSRPRGLAAAASNSKLCDAVCTNTDKPCPTSMTRISTGPGAGGFRSGHNIGRNKTQASARPGVPRGSSSQKAARHASAKATNPVSASHIIEPGQSAIASSALQSQSITRADACQQKAAAVAETVDSKRPSNASGTTHRLITGTPTRLATGPGMDACPKNQIVSGSKPSTATPCALRKLRTCPVPRDCGRHQISQPTPAKLSQKPGASTLRGSNSSTATRASAYDSRPDCGRRNRRAESTTAIISQVRTVGSAKPASAVYAKAENIAANATACGLGRRLPHPGNSRNNADMSSAPRPPTMPTWNPEIAIC